MLTVRCDAVHYCWFAAGVLPSAAAVVVVEPGGDARQTRRLVVDAVRVFVTIVAVGRRNVAARVAALVRERASLTDAAAAVLACYNKPSNSKSAYLPSPLTVISTY